MAVVVVTGCSSGIGLETAIAFAADGNTVYATMRDISKAERLTAATSQIGAEVKIVALDVASDTSVKAAADKILGETGAVDVLVNNAGIGRVGTVEELDETEAREMMETNFWGPFRLIRAFLPSMRARHGGVIVNVSSVSARVPAAACMGFYVASKQALGAMSEALRHEVAEHGVRVVVVEPGLHRTEVEANLPSPAWSPIYADMASQCREAVVQAVRAGADPFQVAKVILAATHDPGSPLHILVGLDAETMVRHYGGIPWTV